jgi:hypothetical protein
MPSHDKKVMPLVAQEGNCDGLKNKEQSVYFLKEFLTTDLEAR